MPSIAYSSSKKLNLLIAGESLHTVDTVAGEKDGEGGKRVFSSILNRIDDQDRMEQCVG